MAGEEEWYFEEEGCLQFSGRPISVTFSPTSNCFICTLEDGTIEVVDVRSGLRLKRTAPAGSSGPLQCRFCPEVEKLFITNGKASGLRKDLNGVLLLDSILQPQMSIGDQAQIVLEISLPDAIQLLAALDLCMPTEKVVLKPMQVVHAQLKEEIDKAQSLVNATHDKAVKWYTCQLKQMNSTLRVALNSLVSILQKNHRNSTALPVVSAILARIINLTGKVDSKKPTRVDKIDMFVEALRRRTFLSWPHKEYRWAYPEAMAKAGFYHQPSNSGDDRALCFTCNVCLVCWEPTDEPWSEHERHAPDCPFVRGDHTENVPMAVSLATGPAQAHEANQVKLISESSCSFYLATCSEEGHVTIWDIRDQLQVHSQFQVNLPAEAVESVGCDQTAATGPPTSFVAWAGPEDDEGIATSKAQDTDCTTDAKGGSDGTADMTEVSLEGVPMECQDDQDDQKCSRIDSPLPTEEIPAGLNSVHKLRVTAMAVVCSCGKESPYTTGQNYQSIGHTATLVLAVSIDRNSVADNGATADGNSGEDKFGPYILVYDILPGFHSKSQEVITDQNFSIVSSMEIEKEMLLQDPFTPSGSEDDWMYDPVPQPHPLHSSVLQKFAEAITGNENDTKEKSVKPEEESVDPGKVVQCLQVSNIIQAQCCKVSQIVPLGDGQNLLVNIHFCESCRQRNKSPTKSKSPEKENVVQLDCSSSPVQESNQNVSGSHNFKDCIVVVYRIVISNGERTLSQQPTRIKQFFTLDGLLTSIVALPIESHELFTDATPVPQEGEAEVSSPSQFLVAAVRDSVVIIDANSLNVLAKFSASNESASYVRFTHVLNCPGVDCLCACTEDGNMHFVALRHQLAGRELMDAKAQDSTDAAVELPTAGTWTQSDRFLDPNEPVTLECLLSLIRLTEYVTLIPRFTASVPSSWVEVQQDQQHLHQQTLLHPVLHTRTWKLCTDKSSTHAKEQVVELLLPKYCQLGHVDVRFALNAMTSQPATNVYLLKSSCPISFKPSQRTAAHCPVKNKILATAREQGSIVCGPVSLKLGLDSTGRQGRVTLTSPDLIKTSSRILLIVFEICGPTEDLAEVSVTVTRFKNNSPVEWRLPRSSLLEDRSLSKRFLDICVGSESVCGVTRANEGRKLALELLCWLGGTCVNGKEWEKHLANEVELYLPKLIRTCYLQCGRSIAHRCSRLLMICGRQVIGSKGSVGTESSFRKALLDAILDVLPDTPCAVSSGAIHWLFKLLTGFAAQADSATTSSRCLELLECLSSRLADTTFHEHLTLRARYGLYGCPLDPVLFDAIPQTSTAQHTPPINGVSSSLLGTSRPSIAVNTDHEAWSSVNSSLACQGLLEVQPLHFVCCSSSDGARVERGDVMQPPGSLGPAGTQTAASIIPEGGGTLAPKWPTVSASLAVLEQELQLLKQHQQQLVSLQQTKQQLEKHKKDLEDLSMWSLFPKLLSKVEYSYGNQPAYPNPYVTTIHTSGAAPGGPPIAVPPVPAAASVQPPALINLAQQKKLGTTQRNQERPAGASVSQPLQQHLMQLPQPQVLVIDRLHAGARHHVLLDFGCVVQLTDVLIPQCSDITSLSLDVFTHWEDLDVERIAVVSDINLCAFVLKDLLPPPVCRYVKLTVVGRPKNNAKARVKIGEFYGHPLCGQPAVSGETQLLDAGGYDHHCLPILHNLLEDIHCHYNLSCTQLRTLLQSSSPRSSPTDLTARGATLTEEERKIHKAYDQCLNLQRQLNLVERSICRLTYSSEDRAGISCLSEAKNDHLRVVCKCLVDTVVALMGVGPSSDGFLAKAKVTLEWQPWLSEVSPMMCETLFRNLCIHGSPQLRERVGALLLNSCGNKPWWGEFLANVLKEFFSSNQKSTFSQERMFVVIVSLSQCSPSIELVLTSFLKLLDGHLLLKDLKVDVESVDLTLLGWLLLLLAHVLDTCIVQCKPPSSETADRGDNPKASAGSSGGPSTSGKSKSSKAASTGKTYKQSRWDFMLPMPVNQASGLSSDGSGYSLPRRKYSKYSPSLSKKAVVDPQSQQSLLKGYGKQQYSYKHMKDLVKLRRQQHQEEEKPDVEETTSQPIVFSTSVRLPTSTTVPVMRKMVSFILNMSSDCSVDLFLVVCKVLAHLSFVSEPCVCLSDVATDDQVERLLRMCVMPTYPESSHWGGFWTVHSLTTLIQDLLQGEKGSQMCDTQKSFVEGPEPQENGRESPSVATNSDSKLEKSVLVDVESGDSLDEYDVPPIDGIQAVTWLEEFGETKYFAPQVVVPMQEKPVASSSTSWEGKVGPPPVKLSSAIDMRLELGLEMEAEQDLIMLEHLRADAIAKGLSFTLTPSRGSTDQPRRPPLRNGSSLPAESILQSSFCKIFNDCSSPAVDVVSLMHLWLRIRLCSPGLKLDECSLSNLLSHLVCQPELSSQSQQLCCQVLKAVSEGQMKSSAQSGLAEFLKHGELLRFLVKGLSQTPSVGQHFHPPSTKPVKAFLSSLQSAVKGYNSVELSSLFQGLLLKMLLELSNSRVSNRAAAPQVEPVISILLEHSNTLWCPAHLDVIVQLVDASVQLTLDHLTHRQSISLLPSTDLHSPPVPGATADKLDDSDWLVQLLFLVIQISQSSANKKPRDKGDQLPASTSAGESKLVCEHVQERVGNCSTDFTGEEECVPGLADKLVEREETLLCMLRCLNLCAADHQGVLLTATCLAQDSDSSSEVQVSGKPASVEDGILRVLCVIQNQVIDRGMLVDGILVYLQRTFRDDSESSSPFLKQPSEPLLWLMFKLLNSTHAVSQFYEKGGLDITCQSIASGQTASLDPTPSGLIPVMQELAARANKRAGGKATTSISEADWTKPTINFAPYGNITCPSSPKHPPDALLKATAPHRRARSAAWSYRFPPEEEWCELVVSLPTAVLLSEVHIQPHSTGLATCPSHVALDVSNDRRVLVPVCRPVLTTGISVIKLKLQHPQVSQHIHIHCHCPRDSHVLGLSQIRVYGTSLYGSQSMVNQALQKSKTQGASLSWVRLLGHCLAEGPELRQMFNTPSTLLSDVFSTCTALLLSPQSGMFSGCVELVLMKLSVQFPELGTLLIKQLLKGSGDGEKQRSPVVNMATVELIYQLGILHDAAFQDRLAVISSWLKSVLACEPSTSVVATPGHIQAVAAVIWDAKKSDAEDVVKEHFSESLFRDLFQCSQAVSDQSALKQSIDHLIGALSYICPPYYDALLELTGVKKVLNEPRKKGTPSTSALSSLLSSPSKLATLATASRSPVTGNLLLDSGLLELLVGCIADCCNALLEVKDQESLDNTNPGSRETAPRKGNGVPINLLPQLLNFLTYCCQEPCIKDHMGEAGYQFWFPLLSLLCKGHDTHGTLLLGSAKGTPSFSSYERFAIETATVELLCKCVHCHPRNQEKMASLLCDIIGGQDSLSSVSFQENPQSTMRISGFMRQLMLQMLLQEEKVSICLHLEGTANVQVHKGDDFFHTSGWHPSFGAGHSFMLFSARWSSSLQELSDQILFPFVDKKAVEAVPEDKNSKPAADGSTDPDDFGQFEGFEFLESVSLAAGLNVKSKRTEKTEVPVAKESKAPSENHNQSKLLCSFYHGLLGDAPLPHSLTLAQLLQSLMIKGIPSGTSCIELTCRTKSDDREGDSTLLQVAPLMSPLDVFAEQNGLSQLSVHLPSHLIIPAVVAPSGGEEGSPLSEDSRWPSYPTRLPLPLVSLPASVLSTVPAHSLVAFGLFIQLPGYDKVLLQDRLRARYLLRLLLGAKQDSEGGAILSSPVANSLSTLPFQVLRILFQSSALALEEGAVVRRAAVEVGAIQLVLLCLAVLSHHQPQTVSHTHKLALQALSALTGSMCRDGDVGSASERTYWAKGTGFGTGSTSSGWDVEQAMLKQRAEEEHVTCLLQVLASYVSPFGKTRDSSGGSPRADYPSTAGGSDSLPATLLHLLNQSCLIPTLSSYLRNDSVLDMARHVPLYQAVLEVLRAVATCPVLLPLLLPRSNGSSHSQQQGTPSCETPSVVSLLEKMKQCVDTYSKTLRSTQGKKDDPAPGPQSAGQPSSSGQGSQGQSTVEEKRDPEAEGLALLIPDIQETARLMQKVVQEFHEQQVSDSNMTEGALKEAAALQAASLSNEERYLATIRPLQFGTHKIVIETKDGKLDFDSGGYHFSSSVRSAASGGGNGGMVRARRLAQEVSSLATSLPLSSSSSVFVRCDKERLDVMKVLITGPSDTPYANGCFEFDVYFPQNYPESPMYIHFETTGHHSIRFNPNLYNDGKVCLSILNTWHGRPEEKWNPQNSSFLQVLVSIQSLILVHEPYFNEPGYERSRGTPAGQQNSREYDANICQATVRWAMLEQLRKPSPCFKQVIQAHFYLKKEEILEQCEKWIKDTESLISVRSIGRAISHHVQSLKQNTALLRQELAKLTPPPEHKESDSEGDSD